MREENCIFCKIMKGEVPSASIYEEQDFKVILDLSPASKGHVLIIPKEHCHNLYDMEDEAAAKVMVLAKKIALRMKEVLKCDGINLIQNNEEAAGQTVFHFHMHLIPRYKNDNLGIKWNMGTLTDEAKEELVSVMGMK